jgi:SAM-dependent methyltransferase
MCYDKLANVFDERYQYQSFPGIQDWLRRLAISAETRKVLEVGCGTGHWLNILNHLQIELFGLDPSGAMLEKARLSTNRAMLICAAAEAMPFEPRFFDLIFCVNSFHHFRDPVKFLRDSRSLLRNNGRLAIFGLDPHAAGTDWYLYDHFPGVRERDLARYLPVAELKRLMAEAGFQNVFAEAAEHIEKAFKGDAVFKDPFLVRESTSQLLLVPEESYLQGRRAMAAAIEKAEGVGQSLLFHVDLRLFGTLGQVKGFA